MTTRYVGPGGNDGNSGLTWALRKLTLNGVEDTPVVAGDTVYVGPGVYREQLTCDIDGSSGSLITYIGDVTGENTDGVGGEVRITGSDDDQTATRSNAIYAFGVDYRTFRGFRLDYTTDDLIYSSAGTPWIIEDCVFIGTVDYGFYSTSASAQTGTTVRRCIFFDSSIGINNTGSTLNIGVVIENCLFLGATSTRYFAVFIGGCGGVTIHNCAMVSCYYGVYSSGFPGSGTAHIVNNCAIQGCNMGLYENVSGSVAEDYNALFANATDRTTVATGANSITAPWDIAMPLLKDGYRLPWDFPRLRAAAYIGRLAGSSSASEDMFGVVRPATDSKRSWGPLQIDARERETTTTQGGSTASVKMADAGRVRMYVPVGAESTTITVYCYRQANYAGTLPQMIIKQPGQSDRTTTDTGSVSTWNQLSDTFTPAANPPYVIVDLVSNNTATSGSYAAYFDTMAVS